MYTDEDLNSAIAAGVISEAAATALRAHVASLKQESAVDEEHFRLITGFNDIFVVIACTLLLTSVAWIGTAATAWLGAAGVAVTAWLLAEFFIRRRHMALPAIVLLLAFVGGIEFTGVLLMGKSAAAIVAASTLAALAAWLHWLRFQVPITVAAGAAAVVGGVTVTLVSLLPETILWRSTISFVAGIMVFLVAMQWDAADRTRQTRKSDVAFWLHLLAAPLLVHPVFSSLGVFDGNTSLPQGIAVFVLYIVIALISLCIDRRALMVSALAYVLYTFSALLKHYGVVSLSFAITALVIGASLLLLSAFWHPSRALVLKLVPYALQNRLAPSS